MTQQRAWSPSFDSVSAVADRALQAPSGVDISFTIHDLGTKDACKHAARSFQKSFTALRARARRKAEVEYEERRGNFLSSVSSAQGIYDALVCSTHVLEDGSWIVSLIPSRVVMSTLRVTDRETGAPVEEIGRDDELMNLIRDATAHVSKGIPWDLDKWERADELYRAKHGTSVAFDPEGNEWLPRSSCVRHTPINSLVQLDEHRAPLDDLVDSVASGGKIFDE